MAIFRSFLAPSLSLPFATVSGLIRLGLPCFPTLFIHAESEDRTGGNKKAKNLEKSRFFY
jgi:hypothetical protein